MNISAGIAGGVPLAAAASDGITTPVLYNPYNDAGSRYTELADSQIQRLYHSNAFLLTSGQVSPGMQLQYDMINIVLSFGLLR